MVRLKVLSPDIFDRLVYGTKDYYMCQNWGDVSSRTEIDNLIRDYLDFSGELVMLSRRYFLGETSSKRVMQLREHKITLAMLSEGILYVEDYRLPEGSYLDFREYNRRGYCGG